MSESESASSPHRHSEWLGGRYLLAILFAALCLMPFVLPNRFWFDLFIQIFINATVAIGLNLLVGLAGQISLGHAGFFALGAYSAVLLPKYLGIPTLVAIPAGIVIVAVVALAIGKPLLRLKGHYLAMTTLAFGILVFIFLNNTSNITGGPDGIAVPSLTLGSLTMPTGQTLAGVKIWYVVQLVLIIVAYVGAVAIQHSAVGRSLRAVRDSEIATRFCGVDVDSLKVFVFVLSAIYAGTAGVFAAFYSGYVSPELSDFMYSTILITMIVLGGLGSAIGAVIGAAILTVLPHVLAAFRDYESAMLGLILVVCMIFFRRGLVPTLGDSLREWHARRNHRY